MFKKIKSFKELNASLILDGNRFLKKNSSDAVGRDFFFGWKWCVSVLRALNKSNLIQNFIFKKSISFFYFLKKRN